MRFQVHHVLSEIIQGGLVVETNINEVSACGESCATGPRPLSDSRICSPSISKEPKGLGGFSESHLAISPCSSRLRQNFGKE